MQTKCLHTIGQTSSLIRGLGSDGTEKEPFRGTSLPLEPLVKMIVLDAIGASGTAIGASDKLEVLL